MEGLFASHLPIPNGLSLPLCSFYFMHPSWGNTARLMATISTYYDYDIHVLSLA